jgi:Cu/Zn superoxide dismutase
MPAGSVTLQRDTQGHLEATLNVFGLTPGSDHNAQIEIPGAVLNPAAGFSTFTADAKGQTGATLTAASAPQTLPDGSRFAIHLGAFSRFNTQSPLAEEVIAQTTPLPKDITSPQTFPLQAVSFDAGGNNLGLLTGTEQVGYDPAAHTLTVTVTAHGLTPGAHAAHIHAGSCQNQGPVQYMMADLVADAHGDIVNQTRVITGVTSAPPATGWYLNLHQGDMNAIVANGAPTLNFRPLLCADLTNIPTVSGSSSATSGAGMTMPSGSASASMSSGY